MSVTVTVDDRGVTRNAGEDGTEAVAWDDLAAVVIRTTGLGPFTDDVFWLLQRGDGSVLVVPSESAGVPELMEALQRLPGFDNEAVIAAATSTEDALFPCWAAP